MSHSHDEDFELMSPSSRMFFDNEVLKSDEAAEFLGIAKKTLYKWVNENGLPVRRIGKSLRFLKADLLEWLRKE